MALEEKAALGIERREHVITAHTAANELVTRRQRLTEVCEVREDHLEAFREVFECSKEDCTSTVVYSLTDGSTRPPRECPDCGPNFDGPFKDSRERQLVDLTQTVKSQAPGRRGVLRFEIDDD